MAALAHVPKVDLNPLPAGTEIGGGHRIEAVLGQGSFGITYRVCAPGGGEARALKEFAPREWAFRDERGRVVAHPLQVHAFAEGLAAFRREAEFLRDHGKHPNIVRVRALFSKFNTAYILMEIVDGQQLRRLIQDKRLPDQRQLLGFLKRIGGALAHLHDQRFLHRDVKPENIMMDRQNQPILIDFGAARHVRPAMQQTRIFTPDYAPVEQQERAHADGEPMFEGPWTDIFALGVTTHELASGQRPAMALERLRTVLAEGRDPYVPLQKVVANRFSAEFCDGVDRACQLLPQSRPGSIDEWLRMLAGSRQPSGRTEHRAWGAARELTRKDMQRIVVVPVVAQGRSRRRRRDDQQSLAGSHSEGLTIGHVVYLLIVVAILVAACIAIFYILR